METAVYLFTGFLDCGKTSFIKETLKDPNFNNGEHKYLIIQCEDGEEEILPEELSENVRAVSFTDCDRMSPDRLSALAKRACADVVIIEYNGMWTLDRFYNALPSDWMVFQEVFIADSKTVLSYNLNMRQLVVDKLTSAEMVVFNRTDENTDKSALHKLVRGVSRSANICYENENGDIEFDNIEDPLPFDINAELIDVRDEDFAIFYREVSEDFEKFNGKSVRFKGICALDPSLKTNEFAVGRHIMTCCEADIAYRGFVAKSKLNSPVSTRDWVIVEGKLNLEYSPLYRAKGPVLNVTKIEKSTKPEIEVATFY
jgi:uncharacterized repeat protein (TIGR03943 family)